MVWWSADGEGIGEDPRLLILLLAWSIRCPRLIFARKCGPNATSIVEVLFGVNRWSSTLLLLQVVRPRRRCGGRRFRLFVGNAIILGTFFSDLGVFYALWSPASGGGGSLALDCFIFLSTTVLFL
jgi:hypothetical protein